MIQQRGRGRRGRRAGRGTRRGGRGEEEEEEETFQYPLESSRESCGDSQLVSLAPKAL